MTHNYSYNSRAVVTLDNFRALLNEWNGIDGSVEHILTGMITVLKMQGLDAEVETILQARSAKKQQI